MKKIKLFLLILSVLLISSCSNNSNIKEIDNSEKTKELFYSPLSGLEVEEDISLQPAFAVMLDNHPDAIPQSGLNSAEVIYEFKAEGEFTRFLAFFMKDKADVIGPVRSARPYFVNTAKEFNAIYAHWGGSDAGYAQIPTLGLKDLDGIYLEGSTFYRNKEVNKRRPHDGYTSYKLMYDKSKELGYLDNLDKVKKLNFDISSDLNNVKKQMGDIEAKKLSIDFFKHYNMTFEYAPDSNSYLAIRNGEPVVDERDNSPLMPKNIILQFAKSSITGPKETLTIDHIGSGEGKLFTVGKVIDIVWEKTDAASKTIFKTLDGQKILLTPGLSFVEVADPTDNIQIEPGLESENQADNSQNENSNNKN
ncbi:MAG: DUF3048 domain-containing protein [Peptoniphilaceae bacterium]